MLIKTERPREYEDKLERLVGLKSDIQPDGATAICQVVFADRGHIDVHVTLPDVSSLLHEFRQVSGLMVSRQRLTPDRGAEQILTLARNALRIADVDAMVCPFTGDRIVIFQFPEHAPMAFRASAEELIEARRKVDRAAALAAH